MGTASRASSTSRSRSPRRQTEGISQNIPEMFRSQRHNMAPSRHSPPQPSDTPQLNPSPLSTSANPLPPDNTGASAQPHLNIQDLRTIAADIKDTLSAAIADLRIDIHILSDRVHEVEQVAAKHDQVLRKATRRIDTHTLQLRESSGMSKISTTEDAATTYR